MTREEALKVIRGEIDLCEEESVDALELEDVYDFVEHSIPLDRIKEAREEVAKGWYTRPANRYEEGKKDRSLECMHILDKLIAEAEGTK